MINLSIAFRWLSAPHAFLGIGRTITWWEVRRVPLNVLLGVYAVICYAVFVWGITTSGALPPGKDAEEPMALLLVPFAFNACYTLGWMVAVSARLVAPNLTPRLGQWLMALGLGFSTLVISTPAVFWGTYRCLQLAGRLH